MSIASSEPSKSNQDRSQQLTEEIENHACHCRVQEKSNQEKPNQHENTPQDHEKITLCTETSQQNQEKTQTCDKIHQERIIQNVEKLNSHHVTHIHPHSATNLHPIGQSLHHVHVHPSPPTSVRKPACNCHLSERSENGADDEILSIGRKIDVDDRIEVSSLPPALPPRPPPRPRTEGIGAPISTSLRRDTGPHGGGIKKYVFWCCACGGLSTILGALFLAVYFLLRTYTSSLGYFETIPTFIPATMLMLTGICVISLARRRNRYSYLIKVCGLCCLVCALTCVLVTITTTVIHMNRLQTLKECVYTQKTRTCTCYSILLEAHTSSDEGSRFVFDSTPDCEVIHGALYSCLRAMFGLSVSGILVCIFSCMLVYQLLSHEKKKMYWEQLELRCRSFYQQQRVPSGSTHGSVREPPLPPATYCSCCEECQYPPIAHVYPWDAHHVNERFWTPRRVGNFYSPNPEENPGSENRERSNNGWSWRRLPWNRNNSNQNDNQQDNSLTYQGVPSSADSQYGFSNRSNEDASVAITGSSGSYSVLDNRPIGGVYVWGPPPPYSNPNSPARRAFNSPARYHHIHHHSHSHEPNCFLNETRRNQEPNTQRNKPQQTHHKDNYENTGENEMNRSETNESTDTSSCQESRTSHTLPARKMKKKIDVDSVKSVSQSPGCRTNVKHLFNHDELKEDGYHEPNLPELKNQNGEGQSYRFLPRLQGVENAAFQKQENSPQKPESTESEVYFADVSSCCNISVRNDCQDSLLYDEAVESQNPRLDSLKCVHKQNDNTNKIIANFHENISSATVTEDEDCLQHKLDKRQMSVRNHLIFPLHKQEEITSEPVCTITKEVSLNSICSGIQTPMTETTDDTISPKTPTPSKTSECCLYYTEEGEIEQQHRTFSKASLEYLAPDAQYEVVPNQNMVHTYEKSNLANTISNLSNYEQNYMQSTYNKPSYPTSFQNPKNSPPKTLNLNQTSKRKMGSNISTLIQNLGTNHIGLLYSEAKNAEDEEEFQSQICQSDATIDSGWHSGSEKLETKTNDVSEQLNNIIVPQKSVNV